MNSIGQTVFELESGNENVDGQTDRQTDKNGQTNRQNYTNFEKNLTMMVIYVPVKFEFDWTNRFELESGNEKCGRTDVAHINLIGGWVTHNPPKKYPQQPLRAVG